VTQTVELEGGELSLLQPAEGAEIPDDGPVEWAPIAPYWSILWRSGLALAREVAGTELDGQRVIELGSGLGLPSLAAARSGAEVLAVDVAPEAIELLEANARKNGVRLAAALADWSRPDPLLERGPFDLVLGADVLYERQSTAPLLSLLPRLAPEAWIADPGRPAATSFLHQAEQRWKVETSWRGVVSVNRIRL
jgi:predicted nicotinamide N-methyase